ncbi:MAG: hypothetical protein QOF19_2019 [Alphaproteobacteria bacterium]|jgi:hypothetical protein|nr:hypothetical protein [Alphaproteobacteria bacterium]
MTYKTIIYLGLAGLCLAASVPAKAQDSLRAAQLPPYEILTIVRSTGLEPLSQPLRRGSTYILRAIDGYGEEVRVMVDARGGEILSVQPVVPVAAPYGAPGPRYVDPRYLDPRYVDPRYAERRYVDPLYTAEPDAYQPDARYAPQPSDPRSPRVIYAPRDKAPAPKPATRAKGGQPAGNAAPAPKSAAVAPAKPASNSADPIATNSTPPETSKTAPAAAPATPPVQTFE